MADLIGRTLGKYRLTERLGHGGMADVYKAHHTKLDRDVTIKVLHGHLVEGQDFLERFEREARAVAALRHAHIVGIHDFEAEGELYYMVMEYVDGGSLAERLAALSKSSAFLSIRQVASILRQVGEALDYAHAQGVIHRDIKPSNILLDSRADAYLTDFGIARMLSATEFTATGALIGTPAYMSPEQGQGLELDATSDIYSLGVVLFEMLTGKAPFASDTPLAVIHKHIHEPLPRASALRPGLPAQVEKVLLTAAAKDHQERYQTAREFTRAFEEALTDGTITALDAAGQSAQRPIGSLPTMRVEDAQRTTRLSDQPTEAMSAGTLAEVMKRPPPEPQAETRVGPRQGTPVPAEPGESPPEMPEMTTARARPARLKSRSAALVVLGLLLVIALVLAFGNLPGGEDCNSVEACMALIDERLRVEDLPGALEAIDLAIKTVPPHEHQPFAWLWCDRAVILDGLGEFGEADASRETCMRWERGE